MLTEHALQKHVDGLFRRNISCKRNLSFLGAGCWQHFVPPVCDEIANRAEFKTAYCGDTYSDKGKYQAVFEYTSMLGELLGYEVVCCPTYDWYCAASSALLMAGRITGRRTALVAASCGQDKLSHMHNFCRHALEIVRVDFDERTGLLNLEDLAAKLGPAVAAVYFETPGYLGTIEVNAAAICRMAHEAGALSIVGVDPISLGALEAPALYGADLCVGDAQPLGNRMNAGGGMCGFIASRDEDVYCNEYPTYLYSIAPGAKKGDFGFAQCTHERTSYVRRDSSPDYIGTSAWLAAITASVYLALMGPKGMREVGETILQRRQYAQNLLDGIAGVDAKVFSAPAFKEFVVNFDKTGKTVEQINQGLLEKGIFGGKDLSGEYPRLGQSALYCVTEIHDVEDIKVLRDALKEVVTA